MTLVENEVRDLVNKYGFDIVRKSLSKIAEENAADEYARAWRIYCRNPKYRFKEDDLGRTFIDKDEIFKITGLKTANTKYPILANRLRDGRRFKYSASSVHLLLDMTKTL